MIIPDTNVWIFALTGKEQKYVDLIEGITLGRDDECRVSAYIFEEVRTNIEGSERPERWSFLDWFVEMLDESEFVIGPS